MQYLCILLLWGYILDHFGPLGCLGVAVSVVVAAAVSITIMAVAVDC